MRCGNMKNKILIIAFQLIAVFSFAQNEYILTDTASYGGVLNLIEASDKSNAKVCQRIMMDSIIRYTPYEIRGYRLRTGAVYKSMEIQRGDSTIRVFLEELHDGILSIMYYRGDHEKVFYMYEDSNLVELRRHGNTNRPYKNQLRDAAQALGCQEMIKTAGLVAYRKLPMMRYARRVDLCNGKPFRYIRYGITLGYGRATFGNNFGVGEGIPAAVEISPQGITGFGAFLDLPVLLGDLSIYLNPHYFKYALSYNRYVNKSDIDLVVNVEAIKLPVMIRYTLPLKVIRPYANGGLIVEYNHQVEYNYYQSLISPDQIEISKPFIASFSGFQSGFAAGAGIEFDLTHLNSLFMEIRYDQLMASEQPETVDLSTLSLILGINF